MSKEIWKDIDGYEGRYQVSSLGRIKSLKRTYPFKNRWGGITIHPIYEKYLSLHINRKKGYVLVGLRDGGNYNGYSVHRLVAKAFIQNPNNLPEVNHKDFNKRNNAVENLEWVSRLENRNHARSGGRFYLNPNIGEKHPFAKLTEDAVRDIRTNRISQTEYTKLYNISFGALLKVQRRRTWKSVL